MYKIIVILHIIIIVRPEGTKWHKYFLPTYIIYVSAPQASVCMENKIA